MPRKSTAELSVVPMPLQDVRPSPPEELSAEEATHWTTIVWALPHEWFQYAGEQDLLVQYLKTRTRSRHLARMIEATDPDQNLNRYGFLLKISERQTQLLAMLATRLRMTPQARYAPRTAARVMGDSHKQWEGVK